MIKTVNKDDLMKYGFLETTSRKIIRQGKEKLVEKGFDLYANKRVGTIPISVAEDIVGFKIEEK